MAGSCIGEGSPQRLRDLPDYDSKKLKISIKNNKKINLFSGPYSTINFMKNDYIQLKKFGFEELDITKR